MTVYLKDAFITLAVFAVTIVYLMYKDLSHDHSLRSEGQEAVDWSRSPTVLAESRYRSSGRRPKG